jgi:alanine-glyoxylate transaminase/serine-glyoxylate transaminase/serine-pyruvate transaminase
MRKNFHSTGRHFLNLPVPVSVPERVLLAMDRSPGDHRSPEFAETAKALLASLKRLFRTTGEVVVYPASSTGAWEAALVNTLSPGDRILIAETGHYSSLRKRTAEQLGLRVDYLAGEWRRGIEAGPIESRLEEDTNHEIRAVCVVHNETSTGVTSNIAEIRAALDRQSHPALLLVDAVSSIAAIDYRQDEWGVDVTIAGSQKGLMLPPGLGFNAISARALKVSESAQLARSYWHWGKIIEANRKGRWPVTPPVNLLYGLAEVLDMLEEEGFAHVFERHHRHAEATRRALAAWGFEMVCEDPGEYSNSVSAVFMPLHGDGTRYDPGAFLRLLEERFEMSLAVGLGKFADSTFRIGHVGHLNDLTVAGALAGIEMGLKASGIPYQPGGTQTALDYLANLSTPSHTPR